MTSKMCYATKKGCKQPNFCPKRALLVVLFFYGEGIMGVFEKKIRFSKMGVKTQCIFTGWKKTTNKFKHCKIAPERPSAVPSCAALSLPFEKAMETL